MNLKSLVNKRAAALLIACTLGHTQVQASCLGDYHQKIQEINATTGAVTTEVGVCGAIASAIFLPLAPAALMGTVGVAAIGASKSNEEYGRAKRIIQGAYLILGQELPEGGSLKLEQAQKKYKKKQESKDEDEKDLLGAIGQDPEKIKKLKNDLKRKFLKHFKYRVAKFSGLSSQEFAEILVAADKANAFCPNGTYDLDKTETIFEKVNSGKLQVQLDIPLTAKQEKNREEAQKKAMLKASKKEKYIQID